MCISISASPYHSNHTWSTNSWAIWVVRLHSDCSGPILVALRRPRAFCVIELPQGFSFPVCVSVSIMELNKVSFHAAKTNQRRLSPASEPPLSISDWHQCEGSNMCNFMHIWTWTLTTHHTTSCAHINRQFQLWKYFTAPTRTVMCNMFTNPATLPLSVSYCSLNLSPPLSLCVHQNGICWSVYTPGSISSKCPVCCHWWTEVLKFRIKTLHKHVLLPTSKSFTYPLRSKFRN